MTDREQLPRRWAAEGLGAFFLFASVIGSEIMAAAAGALVAKGLFPGEA